MSTPARSSKSSPCVAHLNLRLRKIFGQAQLVSQIKDSLMKHRGNYLPYFMNMRQRVITPNDVTSSVAVECLEAFTRQIQLSRQEFEYNNPWDYMSLLLLSPQQTIETPDPLVGWKGEGEDVYWRLLATYPVHRPLSPTAQKELFDSLTYFMGEQVMGNERVASPFTLKQCRDFISLYQLLRSGSKSPDSRMATVARRSTYYLRHIMSIFQLSLHNSPNSASYNIPAWQDDSILFIVLIISFGSPEKYWEELESARTGDPRLQMAIFQRKLKLFLAEWKDLNLLGTVFLLTSKAPNKLCIHHQWIHRDLFLEEADASKTVRCA
ncbi:hypothetical protein BU17DRAFT_70465 [Hysterangium stoloniferum]|nr:hypothetical protein BU17DRAFT_70465 [Hysterangium stoloniferum]